MQGDWPSRGRTQHLLPTSTVFDTLNLSAQLRLPRSWSPAQRSARVEELLTLLRLERQRDTLVGTANEFIRGERGAQPDLTDRLTDSHGHPAPPPGRPA
jgi:hypothetical protein